MSNNNNELQLAIEAAKQQAAEVILPRFKDYDSKLIESILKPDHKLLPHHHASIIFNPQTLQAVYEKGKIMGVVGKPNPSMDITILTRIGNRGIYISERGSYMQLSFLPGDSSEVSGSNHDPITGKMSDEGILFPPGMVNLKIFANPLDSEQLEQMEQLMSSFQDLDTGAIYKDTNGREKPIYRGTNLVIYYQGDYPKKGNGDIEDISITAIAVVDVKPQAAPQLKTWGKTPVSIRNHKLLVGPENEDLLLEQLSSDLQPELKELGDGDISEDSDLSIKF